MKQIDIEFTKEEYEDLQKESEKINMTPEEYCSFVLRIFLLKQTQKEKPTIAK